MSREPILPHVIHDLSERVRGGTELYGEPLTSLNGRDALWDAYEECADQLLYLRQLIQEVRQGACSSPACAPCAPCSLRLAQVRGG